MLIAFFLFMLAYVALSQAWQTEFSSINSFRQTSGMQLETQKVTDILLKSGGSPTNWEAIVSKSGGNCFEEENISVIGLASSENELQKEKILQFVNCITYEHSRVLLGTNHDYNFTMIVGNGERFFKGVGETNLQKKSVSIKRFVDFNGFDANIFFTLIEK